MRRRRVATCCSRAAAAHLQLSLRVLRRRRTVQLDFQKLECKEKRRERLFGLRRQIAARGEQYPQDAGQLSAPVGGWPSWRRRRRNNNSKSAQASKRQPLATCRPQQLQRLACQRRRRQQLRNWRQLRARRQSPIVAEFALKIASYRRPATGCRRRAAAAARVARPASCCACGKSRKSIGGRKPLRWRRRRRLWLGKRAAAERAFGWPKEAWRHFAVALGSGRKEAAAAAKLKEAAAQ